MQKIEIQIYLSKKKKKSKVEKSVIISLLTERNVNLIWISIVLW